MAERGWNPFVKAFVYFVRSLKPSKFRTPRGDLMGSDHLGNKYFEIPADPSKGKRKPARYFEPINNHEWDAPLPPEWNSWLRMRRDKPPSEEEQLRNLQRLEILETKKEKDALSQIPESPFANDGKFPNFAEYEKVPGSKYK